MVVFSFEELELWVLEELLLLEQPAKARPATEAAPKPKNERLEISLTILSSFQIKTNLQIMRKGTSAFNLQCGKQHLG